MLRWYSMPEIWYILYSKCWIESALHFLIGYLDQERKYVRRFKHLRLILELGWLEVVSLGVYRKMDDSSFDSYLEVGTALID